MTKPPQHPSVLQAQRFFARLRTFDLECPHCGLVYRIRSAGTAPKDGTAETPYWNARTARFRCNAFGGCGYRYTLGILAWPAGTGEGSQTPPADQVPGPRQLPQMRAEADSWWMPDEYRHRGRPDPTNLTGETDRPEAEDPIDLELIDGTEEFEP